MKKILCLLIGLTAINGMSQVTYNINDYGGVGYSFMESSTTSSLGSFDFTLTGANYSWNYAALPVDDSYEKKVIDPATSDYRAAFIAECTANTGNPIACSNTWDNLTDLGRLEFDSVETGVITVYNLTSFMTYSSGYLVANIQGAEIKDTSNTKVPLTSEFIDKDTVYTFPMNYNDNHTSHGKWKVDLNSLGYNIVLVVDYDRSYTVDGWGSLLTPYKLHNDVLKVRTQIDEVDSLYFNGTPFGVPRTIVQYTWFDPNYGMPVMQANGQISGATETIQQVRFMDSTYVGINEDNFIQFSLFPNPANDVLSVNLKETVNFTHAVVIDITGKEYFKSKSLNHIYIGDLAKGTYFVGIYNDDKPLGFKKFTKN